MFSLVQVLISVALLSSVVLASPFTLDNDNNRIVGGLTASRGQYPYQASVRESPRYDHGFGAVIISNRFLLTSAKSINKAAFPKYYRVLVGALNTSTVDGVTYNVEELILHEDFYFNVTTTTVQVRNDIALIKTTDPIAFNKFVARIALQHKSIDGGVQAFTSGWGFKSPNENDRNLKYINATTLSNSACRKQFEDTLPTMPVHDWDTICVTSEKNGPFQTLECIGDYGGPLVSGNKLIGVHSWAKSCGDGLPHGFTRISNYIVWINKKTKLSL